MLRAKLQEAANSAVVPGPRKAAKPEESTFEKVANNTIIKSMMCTAGNMIVRSLLGFLGLGGRSKSASKSWF